MFTLAATYVPQPNTPQAHAIFGSASGLSTIVQDLVDFVVQVKTNLVEAATKAFAAVDKFMDKLENNKSWLLDGIAWATAKAIIGAMTQDLIAWVNSGFSGSPMFLTDTKGFLLDVGNQMAGEYIDSLGGIGSFICSPFRLDVKLAVALHFQEIDNPDEPEKCTLTGIQGNLGNFIDGTERSFENGGWQNWIEISSVPEEYTPFGASLTGMADLSAKLINDKGQEMDLINFGEGFMSQKACEPVAAAPQSSPIPAGASGPAMPAPMFPATAPAGNAPGAAPEAKQKCDVSTPGKVISDALSKGVDSDRESLIAADEANEVFAGIVGQLGQAIFSQGVSLLSGF